MPRIARSEPGPAATEQSVVRAWHAGPWLYLRRYAISRGRKNCFGSTFCIARYTMSIDPICASSRPRLQVRHMARTRGFDEETALDAAIECFRRRGYAATSVRDLMASMKIGGPSLYNSFGDKRTLFVKALERYVERSVRARIRRLESSLPPKRAIRTLIKEVVERSLTDRSRGGCLLINSALEVSPHDSEIAAQIAR